MELKDYIQYYIGCRLLNTWFTPDHDCYDAGWKFVAIDLTSVKPYCLESETSRTWTDSIKPILKKLEDMTEKEMIGLLQSMVPPDMDDKPIEEEYGMEMFYFDNATMVDGDIAVGANYSCRCYEGQIAIKLCGTIVLFDEIGQDATRNELTNAPKAFHYLLKQGFDLFGLCDAGLAVYEKYNPHVNKYSLE